MRTGRTMVRKGAGQRADTAGQADIESDRVGSIEINAGLGGKGSGRSSAHTQRRALANQI